MKHLLALMFLFSVSCLAWQKPTDGNHYHLYIDPGFTVDQHEMIVKASQDWMKATGNFITFDLNAWTANDPNTISIYPVSRKDLDSHEGRLGETWYYGVNSKIEISTDNGQLYRTAIHELGHAMGLQHNPDEGNPILNGIMCADDGCASQDIECVDIVQLCTIWNGFTECVPGQMPGCQEEIEAGLH